MSAHLKTPREMGRLRLVPPHACQTLIGLVKIGVRGEKSTNAFKWSAGPRFERQIKAVCGETRKLYRYVDC